MKMKADLQAVKDANFGLLVERCSYGSVSVVRRIISPTICRTNDTNFGDRPVGSGVLNLTSIQILLAASYLWSNRLKLTSDFTCGFAMSCFT